MPKIGEVQYYFNLLVNNTSCALAMVSVYSSPDLEMLKESCNTVWACDYQGQAHLVVIEAKTITSVVAMVPFPAAGRGGVRAAESARTVGKYFLVEKPGLEVATMNEVQDVEDEEVDNE